MDSQETEKLRSLAESLERQCSVLQNEVARGREMAADNEAMRWLVEFLNKEKKRLIEQLAATRNANQQLQRERDELRTEIAGITVQSREFTDRYVTVEQQNTKLANLYVSMVRLHSSLDPAEIVAAIHEIVINLIGSEELAIFEVDDSSRSLRLISSFGVDANRLRTVRIGEGPVGRAAESGRLHVVRHETWSEAIEASFSAFIPLRVAGWMRGAVVVFGLLPQKGSLDVADVELFDLISTQAGRALYFASLHMERAGAEVRR
ncbi:MAG TPA: GAF domain-containing protein [Thermoanaerobaculia bacterium]|nr:GAF domain-containing protein [Thermoanaerobaculia bacterium]